MLQVAKELKPDRIIVLGDFADFFALSKYDKNPNRASNLEYEVGLVAEGLDELDAIGAKHKQYIAGNHEDRLERYLMSSAPELFNLVKLAEILKLKERGWGYTPYKAYYKLGCIVYTHDLGKAGKYAVHAALADAQNSVIIGHTHRLGYIVEGDATGVQKIGFCPGWLGDLSAIDYKHQLLANRQWALGFGIGYLNHATGYTYFQPVPILRHKHAYSCVVGGKFYSL